MKKYDFNRPCNLATSIYPIVSLTIALSFNVMGQEDEKVEELENTVITGLSASPDAFSPLTTKSLRFGDDLTKTPLTLQVLSEEVIKEIQATDLTDVLEFSAGVARTNDFGGLRDGASIRGFQATFAENGIVSGGPFANITLKRDSASIESVEVLRGASGALFGEGTLGGVVNVITKKPEAGTFLNTRTFGSSEGLFRQELDANTSFGEDDKFQLRFIGSYENNENNFRDDTESDRQYYSLGFDYEHNERLRYSFHLEHSESNALFDRGLPIDANGNFLVDRDINLSDPDVGDTVTENFRASAQVEYDINPDWLFTGRLSFDDNSVEGTSVTGFLPFQQSVIIPQAGINFIADQDVIRTFLERNLDRKLYTGRFDLKGTFDTGNISHEALVGFEYRLLEENIRNADSDPLTSPATINVNNPINDLFPGQLDALLTTNAITDITSTNFAITAFDKISFNDKLNLLIGGRLDYVDSDQDTLSGDFSQNELEFSPSIGVNYDFNDKYTAFASFSESFQTNTEQDINGDIIDPQEAVSAEAGFKFNLLNNRLQGRASYFYIEQENLPTSNPFSFSFLNGGIQSFDSGTLVSQGVDFTLQGSVTDNFSLIFNYTYNDTEFTESSNAAAQGSREAGIALNQASLFANYKFDSGKLDGLSLSGGLVFVGERLGSLPTSIVVPQLGNIAIPAGGQVLDSYIRTDFGGRYELSENATLSFRVENVFDIDYETQSVAGAAVPQAPRTFFAGVELKF